jgi:hypothetical protein
VYVRLRLDRAQVESPVAYVVAQRVVFADDPAVEGQGTIVMSPGAAIQERQGRP